MHGIPKAQPLPDEVWINPPAANTMPWPDQQPPIATVQNVVDSFRMARLEGAAELPPRFLIDRERGETT